MININILMMFLFCVIGISYLGYVFDYLHNASLHIIGNKILGILAGVSVALGFISCIIFLQLSYLTNEPDYSMLQTKEYEKLVFQTDKYDKSIVVVYFPDGTSSEVRKTGIKVNNEDFSNVFIENGQEYTVSWKIFYMKNHFDDENILYVDQETYNKIFQIEEIPLEG